jgi:multidrug efflux pump
MLSKFFIDRPIGAWVVFFVVIILGVVSLLRLPVAQYPEVAPPTISVVAVYPGADARTVAATVATPIEQEINGVENMLYISSQCTNDGQMSLTVTFALGTDLDMAQVLVQNRVSIALPKLPEEVRRQGVITKKKSPSILLCVNLISPDNRYDQLYLSNFATIQIKDALARVQGVGDVTMLGARDYSMRVWLDPDKLASRDLSATDALKALQEQNVQVAAGRLGQPPAPPGEAFQLTLNAQGRLIDEDQFAEIILKTDPKTGGLTRLKDVARVELGAKNYEMGSYLDGKPCVTLALFQLPGSNAVATAAQIRERMEELKAQFPTGVDYRIVYDTTIFVEESIRDVIKTLLEAFVLVIIVVLIFLQDWKATILPMLEVPVSLIGTFFVMSLMGFSLNNLSLFGLVLAIGIVVDDAIVVIENVERWMATGLDSRSATLKAMEEVTAPVLAIAFVLAAVFIPVAFMAGISGQFYKQFALTIAVSTLISAVNALTMTPARCVLVFKNHHSADSHGQAKEALPRSGIAMILGVIGAKFLLPFVEKPLNGVFGSLGIPESVASWISWLSTVIGVSLFGWFVSPVVSKGLNAFLSGFNLVFDKLTNFYGKLITRAIRLAAIVVVIYAGLIGATWYGFKTVPVGFIPQQDKGYLVVNAQLPDGASLERTEAVMTRLTSSISKIPGVAHTISLPGYSVLSSTNLSNAGGMFVILEPFEERILDPSKQAPSILAKIQGIGFGIQEAIVFGFGAPPVDGLGNTGGFKLQVEDRGDQGLAMLQGSVENVIRTASAQPGLTGLFSGFRANQPQIYLDINRTQAKTSGVALNDLFVTLQTYLGSSYVNDFTRFGRNWQVIAQADAGFRQKVSDIGRLKVRNASGGMVPVSSLVRVVDTAGPSIVNHYNLYPSAEINGNTSPGTSSGQAIALMEKIAADELPRTTVIEWTDLTYQQLLADKDLFTKLALPLSVVMVFLVLAFQYESWSLPMAVILIVPLCLLSAVAGIALRGMENNIFTQIGLVVLIALACKNAILIVEFAREIQAKQGKSARDAAVEACQLRLRPILMTSFAFILGVFPLVIAKGAGFEMRQALGTAVFWGMLGVTCFGLLFTPVFYTLIQRLTGQADAKPKA